MDRCHATKDVAGLGTGLTHFRTLSHGDSRCAPGSVIFEAHAETQQTGVSRRAARSTDVQNASQPTRKTTVFQGVGVFTYAGVFAFCQSLKSGLERAEFGFPQLRSRGR